MTYLLDDTIAAIAARAQEILGVADVPPVAPANPKFGADLAIPMFEFARGLGKKPDELARQLATELQHESIAKAEAVGGFVNIWLSDGVLAAAFAQALTLNTSFGRQDIFADQQVVIEHTDPNPFKEFHIGHTYINTVGEAFARLYRLGGADVHQVQYNGDVGMHIAKAIWGIQSLLTADEGEWFAGAESAPGERTLQDVPVDKRVAFLGAAYVHGARAFEDDEAEQEEIKTINKHIYDHDNALIDELHETGKAWSLDYFDEVYKRLQTSFERSYPESEVTDEGMQIVHDNIGRVFAESEGAVVYHGKTADLHTRVFINNRGLPTYEAKDIGLIYAKQRDYPDMDISHVITGNEQRVYYLVVIAAVAEIAPKLAAKMRHSGTGLVKLRGGRKMSSRTGQVVRATEVLDQLQEIISESYDTPAVDSMVLGALKYAYLKQRVGGDIIFDVAESISLEGNSGPYIQYAYARGQSILAKLGDAQPQPLGNLTPAERALTAKILTFPAATAKAIRELAPNHICTYLYELTQQFNRFYESSRIVGDERQNLRATLVVAYVQVLRNGLDVLNIPAPDKI